MTKTSLDVVQEAMRRLAILSADEAPSAEQDAYAQQSLEALFEEVKGDPHRMPFTWELSETPDAAFRPLAWLLATDLAPHYVVMAEPRSRAMGRLRAYAFPDDRDDPADMDGDGTVTDAEREASKRAAYF